MTNKQQQQQHQENSPDNDNDNGNKSWNLSDEFLLASAVHRHGAGAGDWVTVIGELNKRSEQRYSAETCQQKYAEIQQRYKNSSDESLWIDELRKRRVEELERELERNDVNIVALELKVKRLKEEDLKLEPAKPEDLSVNESNSADLKVDPGRTAEEDGPVAEDSCDGSSKPERVNSGEMGECSDVQSSVSLSRKENESTVEKSDSKESEPLTDFLDVLRGNKIWSFFERKLDSQDSSKYTNLIRQHLDFQTIHVRLQEGHYAGCSMKFYRDLLLLANNALVFYGPKSSEFKAATEFRSVVQKEMAFRNSKTDPSKGLPTIKVKLDLGESLLAKSKLSLPLTACRKRSSITAKASSSSSGADRRRIPTASLLDEKPALDSKQAEKSSSLNAEEPLPTKKRTREKFPAGGKSSAKNNKNQTSANKNSDTNIVAGSDKGVGSENPGPKTEKKNQGSTSGKKQSAANFLNRMKQSPSSSNSLLAETSKSSKSKPESGRGAEQKKTSSTRSSDAKKDQRKGSVAAKQVKESPSKKNVGRPPKRGAAPPPSLPAKRTKDAGETSGSRQAKKRARK